MEDIVSTKLSVFYSISSLEHERLNGMDCYKLTLIAKDRSVAYYKIVTYIDQKTYVPAKRDYYAYSGQKIKELVFDEQENNENGTLALLKITMTDVLKKGVYSKVEFAEFDYSWKVDRNMFSIPYMKQAAQ
jgi:negative regulator of sigma E activity